MNQVSVENLADGTEVSKQTIESIENNKYKPSLELAYKIANFFNVEVTAIFVPLRGK